MRAMPDHNAMAVEPSPPAKAASLAERTYVQLRADLIAGRLSDGAPLRLEALRERYGVSLSPLREALSRLQSEHLVVGTAQRGWRVPPLSLAAMWDAIRVRTLLETEALRDAIRHGDDAWEVGVVAALHALRLAARGAVPHEEMERRHHAFHRSLLAACRSAWLLELSDLLYAQTERYRRPGLAGMVRAGGRDIDAEHSALVDAAVARDTDLATARLAAHYRATGEAIAGAKAGTGVGG
jgi:DNA-binding GntR family transcriptional regulator